MSQIFSETLVPDPKLPLPSQWNAAVVTASPSKPDVSVPSVPVESVFSKHVRQIKEETVWEQREKNSKHAIAKWILFLKSDLSASQVGLQIQSDEEAAEDIVLAVLGVKSPSTSLKRANSVLSYHRWHSTRFDTCPIPFVENCCWAYLRHLKEIEAPASRAVSFVQAVRFSHFIFQVAGAASVINSRRIIGLADIQLSMKASTRQARPLSVAEVSKLHKSQVLTAQIVKHCVQHGLLVCIENPQYSLFWATSFWQEVAHLVMYSTIHTCQYGSKRL